MPVAWRVSPSPGSILVVSCHAGGQQRVVQLLSLSLVASHTEAVHSILVGWRDVIKGLSVFIRAHVRVTLHALDRRTRRVSSIMALVTGLIAARFHQIHVEFVVERGCRVVHVG